VQQLNPANQAFIAYLEDALKVKFTLRFYPWLRVMTAAEQGEGMVYGIYKTKDRMEKLQFSEPIFSDTIWLVALCNKTFPFNKISDLKGKAIGMHPGSSAGEEFDEGINKIFRPEHTTTDLTGSFLRLYQHRMDAFCCMNYMKNTRNAILLNLINYMLRK